MNGRVEKLFLVFLAGLSFGSSVVMARFALREIAPLPLAVFRFGIASVFYLLTFLFLKKKINLEKRKLMDIGIVGVSIFGVPITLYLISLTYISSGVFSVLLSTVPIFTAIGAHIFLHDEKINKNVVTGLAFGFIGVLVLLYTRTNGLINESFNIIGPTLVMLGVLLSAGGAVYARKRLQKVNTMVLSGLQTVAAFLVIAFIVFSLGEFSVGQVSSFGWFAVFYNAVIGSYVPFLLIFTLIRKYGATAGSLPSYVMPVVSISLGTLLLHEVVTASLIFGGAAVILGIYFATK